MLLNVMHQGPGQEPHLDLTPQPNPLGDSLVKTPLPKNDRKPVLRLLKKVLHQARLERNNLTQPIKVDLAFNLKRPTGFVMVLQ